MMMVGMVIIMMMMMMMMMVMMMIIMVMISSVLPATVFPTVAKTRFQIQTKLASRLDIIIIILIIIVIVDISSIIVIIVHTIIIIVIVLCTIVTIAKELFAAQNMLLVKRSQTHQMCWSYWLEMMHPCHHQLSFPNWSKIGNLNKCTGDSLWEVENKNEENDFEIELWNLV